jgi:hypothetical protein
VHQEREEIEAPGPGRDPREMDGLAPLGRADRHEDVRKGNQLYFAATSNTSSRSG